MKKETWTAHEELTWNEMSQRRDRATQEQRIPVVRLAVNLRNADCDCVDDLVEWLIYNAEELIDALRPYDSGVRAAEPEQA